MTSLSMLPGNQNPIDPRVIPHEFHVRPIARAHERRDPPSLAGAHLHEQPAARFEPPRRLLEEARHNRQSVPPAVERQQGLLADLAREPRYPARGDIGWIADDQVP